tara:strand:- start:3255 stop:3974 length:720 start_codon:yes stop_codon:yes gene_type:complete
MNQSNKDYLEFLINSGVNFFYSNEQNNFYDKTNININKLHHTSNISLFNINTIEELTNYAESFVDISLKKTANKTVIFDGNIESKLMIIGEAPGKEEDEKGLPFVGKAGQLLDKMLKAISIARNDIYITNVIPWRPPDNRTPTDEEILKCLPILQKQIEIMKPKLIFLLGLTAAKAILSTTLSLSKLRGKIHKYKSINMNEETDVLVSYHPAFLLRSPEFKKEAWIDLKLLKKKFENEH